MTLSRNLSTLGQAVTTAGNIPTANVSGLAAVATTGSANDITTGTLPSIVYTGPSAPIVRVYTSPSTWTKSPTLKGVNVTLVSGGGSGSIYRGPVVAGNGAGGGGGSGGFGSFPAPTIPGPVTVTVGAGGAAAGPGPVNAYTQGNTGGSSSFGPLLSCTGGAGGSNNDGGATGSFTSSPTAIGFIGTPGTPSSVPSLYSGGGGNSFQLWGFGANNTPIPPGPAPTPGNTGTGYGAGGSGAQCTNSPGYGASGPGTTGFVVVEEFY